MTRRVFKAELSPFIGGPFLLYLETPSLEEIKTSSRCRIPMTLHLSENGTDDNLGCYVLGIPDRTGNVHQTLLNGNQELLDVTKRLSYLLTKKYQVVTYVSISGNFTDESIRDVVLEVDKLLSDGRGTQNPLSSTVNET